MFGGPGLPLTSSSHLSLPSSPASEPTSRGPTCTILNFGPQGHTQKPSPNLERARHHSRRAKSALGLRLSGTRCLIACVWLVISLLRVTVPSPCLGCFNVVLPTLRLNIPLTVSSSNLGGPVGIPAGDSISKRHVIRPSVTSRTRPLFGPAYRTPKSISPPLFHRLSSRTSHGLGRQWSTATALFSLACRRYPSVHCQFLGAEPAC